MSDTTMKKTLAALIALNLILTILTLNLLLTINHMNSQQHQNNIIKSYLMTNYGVSTIDELIQKKLKEYSLRYTGNPFTTALYPGQFQAENITGMHWYTYLSGSLYNRTGVVAFPEQTATFIIFGKDTDGDGTYDIVYAKNCTSGQIQYGGDWDAGGIDGSNASAVIQATIDALTSGGTIFIRGGVYGITQIIGISHDGISLIGEGMDVTVLRDMSGLSPIIGTNSKSHVRIEDMTLDGNAISTAVLDIACAEGQEAEDIIIRRVKCKNDSPDTNGFLFAIWDRNSDYANPKLKHVWVEDCIFEDSPSTNIDRIAVSYSKDVTFKNCVFRNIARVVYGCFRSHDVTFENCRFENITNVYSLAIAGERVKVTKCFFYNCRGLRIEAVSSDYPATDILIEGCTFRDAPDWYAIDINGRTSSAENIRIIGNYFINVKVGIFCGGNPSGETGTTRGVVIEGNVFENNTEASIVLYCYAEKCTVKGNIIKNSNSVGISVKNCITTPLNHVIEGNIIWDDRATPNMEYGIYLYASADPLSYVKILNNYVKNSASTGIFVYQCSSNGKEDIDIIGNTVEGCGGHGIHVDYATRVKIYANSMLNNTCYGLNIRYSSNIDIRNNYFSNNTDGAIALTSVTDCIIKANRGYVTENSGTATGLSDGSFISHGLAGTPTTVTLTCLNSTYDGVPVIVSWDRANTNSTHIAVNIYWANGTAITNPVIAVSWRAEYQP